MAAAVGNPQIAYNDINFNKPANITADKIHTLFMHGHNITAVENPYLFILVGSPGVGKTYVAEKYLDTITGTEQTYDNCYHVSLDTIVERVKPFRNRTQKGINYIKDKGKVMTNKLYGPFANLQPTVRASMENGFGMGDQNEKVIDFYKKLNKTMANNTVKSSVKSVAAESAAESAAVNASQTEVNGPTKSPNKSRKKSPSNDLSQHYIEIKEGNKRYQCKYCGGKFVTDAHFKNKTYTRNAEFIKNQQKGGSIDSMFYEALQYGLQQSYNVIYDTTFGSNTNKMDTVMKYLKKVESIYTIVVIHVTAPIKTIQERLRRRHEKMIRNGYLRAIKPVLLKGFIEENNAGFNAVVEAYSDPKYEKYKEDKRYSPSQFRFIICNDGNMKNASNLPNLSRLSLSNAAKP